MGAKTTVAAGAVAAVQDPLHPEGVVYTMPDGSQTRVYDGGGKQLAYRFQNPGIKAYSGPGLPPGSPQQSVRFPKLKPPIPLSVKKAAADDSQAQGPGDARPSVIDLPVSLATK